MSEIPQSVGVLGGGCMGAGIAHAFLTAGSKVHIVEVNDEAAGAAKDRVQRDVVASLERGKIFGQPSDWLTNLTVSTNFSDFAACDLVVEAVPETWDLKVSSLQKIEEVITDDAVLASNTSSLSIDGLAQELDKPQRFLGLHFFNPVPGSKLVEVVLGKETGSDIHMRSLEWVEELGKTPVVVHDAPGFASSRLGVAIALEAMRMVEEGVATAEDIDNAMVLGYKHPIGPLALTDLVGLDVRLGIAEYLASQLGPRFEPPQIMRDMVARGELGRKTNKGFFSYE